MPLQEQAASANDDLVGVVGVLFIADVVEPTDRRCCASSPCVRVLACSRGVASRVLIWIEAGVEWRQAHESPVLKLGQLTREAEFL